MGKQRREKSETPSRTKRTNTNTARAGQHSTALCPPLTMVHSCPSAARVTVLCDTWAGAPGSPGCQGVLFRVKEVKNPTEPLASHNEQERCLCRASGRAQSHKQRNQQSTVVFFRSTRPDLPSSPKPTSLCCSLPLLGLGFGGFAAAL